MEAEVSKAFREEQGLRVTRRMPGRRRKPGGCGRRRHLTQEAAALSSGSALLVVDGFDSTCWSLRAILLPETQSSPPQKTSPECQPLPH